jgi:hypothetical protein
MVIKEFVVSEKSFKKIKNEIKNSTPIIRSAVPCEFYGPEPVGWGGEEVLEKSFEIPARGIRYLCYEHRY